MSRVTLADLVISPTGCLNFRHVSRMERVIRRRFSIGW